MRVTATAATAAFVLSFATIGQAFPIWGKSRAAAPPSSPPSSSAMRAEPPAAGDEPSAATDVAPSNGGDDSSSSSSGSGAFFASPGWALIKRELDQVPVFVTVHKNGDPIVANVGGTPRMMYHVDVDDAQAELLNAVAQFAQAGEDEQATGLDIIPVPLGEAFRYWMEDKALLIPSQAAITAAGAPEGTQPAGQEIPLFACMEIMQSREDGSPALPLFFCPEDAKEAVAFAVAQDAEAAKEENADAQAVAAAAAAAGGYEIKGMSLQQAVKMLAGMNAGEAAFQFVTPSTTVAYIRNYLASGSPSPEASPEASPEGGAESTV